MTQTRRRILTASVAAGVIALFVYALRSPPIAVEVATVRRTELVVTVAEQGRTRARKSFIVAAPITGRLVRPEVDEGDRVVAGEVLATMTPPPEDPRVTAEIRAALAVAQAREREAEAALTEASSAQVRASREAERRAQLFEEGAVSAETREQFAQAAQAANARLGTARAALRAARAEVARVAARMMGSGANREPGDRGGETVLAPAAGTILYVYEESERVVPAGTPLFEIGDSQGIEVIVDLLTEQAVQVEPGDAVEITGWGGGVTLAGRVRYVEPKGFTEISALGVEEQRVNVIVDLVETPASLGAEFRVEAAIITWAGDDVLTVPTSAIFRRGRGWRAFVVDGGVVELREVEIGHRGATRAEVLGGLEADEVVVVFPSDLVEDGVRVDATPALDDGA